MGVCYHILAAAVSRPLSGGVAEIAVDIVRYIKPSGQLVHGDVLCMVFNATCPRGTGSMVLILAVSFFGEIYAMCMYV